MTMSAIARSPLTIPMAVDLTSRRSAMDFSLSDSLAARVQHVRCDGVVGAESFVHLPFVDSSVVFTGTADGRLIRLPRDPSALRDCRDIHTVVHVGKALATNAPTDANASIAFDFDRACKHFPRHESHCGRLLGLRAHPANSHVILAIDASFGLLSIDVVQRTVRVLANHDPATPGDRFVFSNDLVVPDSQSLYFTVSSALWERPFVLYEILEARCTGRLMRFDLESNTVHTVLSRLCAPNGVEIVPSYDAILVVETGRARILRYDIARGTSEVFIELGGYADNIRRSDAYPGEFWIAYAAQLTPLTVLLADRPRFRQFVTGLFSLETIAHMLPQYGLIERRLFADGTLRAQFADLAGGHAAHMSEVHELMKSETDADLALVGSYRNEFLTLMQLDKSKEE